jgi:hypothetical protein
MLQYKDTENLTCGTAFLFFYSLAMPWRPILLVHDMTT